MNFNNIAIIPHHGKATAYILADLCKYLGVDYYLINDWDFDTDFVDALKVFTNSEEGYETLTMWEQIEKETNKKGRVYAPETIKSMITTNKNLITLVKDGQIHFNVKKLETIIDYESDDKDPVKMWQTIKSKFPNDGEIGEDVFPETLDKFLFTLKTQESNLNQEINTTSKPSENDNVELELAKFNDSQALSEEYSPVELPF